MKQTLKKGIVFCHCCNRIVGNSFPVNHCHDFGSGKIAVQLLTSGNYGLAFYEDTEENRQFLKEHYPPRNEITVKL